MLRVMGSVGGKLPLRPELRLRRDCCCVSLCASRSLAKLLWRLPPQAGLRRGRPSPSPSLSREGLVVPGSACRRGASEKRWRTAPELRRSHCVPPAPPPPLFCLRGLGERDVALLWREECLDREAKCAPSADAPLGGFIRES